MAGGFAFVTSGAAVESFAGLVVPGDLGEVFGSNSTNQDRFFQVFDKAAIPILNDVPIISIEVMANTSYSIDELPAGIQLLNGAAFGWSTTEDTFTAGGIRGWIHAKVRTR